MGDLLGEPTSRVYHPLEPLSSPHPSTASMRISIPAIDAPKGIDPRFEKNAAKLPTFEWFKS